MSREAELSDFRNVLNRVDRWGNTPMHYAICMNEFSVTRLKILIDLGARLDIRNNEGRSSYEETILVKGITPPVRESALAFSETVSDEKWFSTPFDEMQVATDSDRETFSDKELEPMYCGNPEVRAYAFSVLVAERLEQVIKFGLKAHSNISIAFQLLRKNKNELADFSCVLNKRDRGGNTPMHYLLCKDHFSVEKLKDLIDLGARLDIRNNAGRLPYEESVLADCGNPEVQAYAFSVKPRERLALSVA